MARTEHGPRSRILGASSEKLPRPFATPLSSAHNDPAAEAYARGLEQGLAAGLEQAQAEFDERLAAIQCELATALARLCALEERLTRECQASMIELALEAASKILRERVLADDPVAARALAEAVAALPVGTALKARLNPADRERVAAELAEELAHGRIELVADERIGRGGCTVESIAGTIDATPETALAAVRAATEGRSEAP